MKIRPTIIARNMLYLVLVAILLTWKIDRWVSDRAEHLTYDQVDSIPHNQVGLLLGTGKYLKNGNINRYYSNRIKAAYKLYSAGKIDRILISGDNSKADYDEPTTMKEDLVAMGVAEAHIFLDYAGFRTFDSVIRANVIFGQQKMTVISQEFHNERALYIAYHKNLECIGFNAEDVGANSGRLTKIRERLARVKMFLDILTNKQPKFIGEPIKIK